MRLSISIPFAPEKQSPLLFLCDHASNAVPAAYGALGLVPRPCSQTHIAYDIGAADVTRALAAGLWRAGVPGRRWSRLLIDLNRGAGRSHPGDEAVGRQHHSRQSRRR